MPYVDGFLIPVPTKNLAAYKRVSVKAGKIWIEHGPSNTESASATT